MTKISNELTKEGRKVLVTEPVRVRFAHVLTEDPTYGGFKITVDFTDAQAAALQAAFKKEIDAVYAEATAAFPGKKIQKVGFRFKEAVNKVTDDSGNATFETAQGVQTLTFKSNYAPALDDVTGTPINIEQNPHVFFRGDLVRVGFKAAVSYMSIRGPEVAVTCYLNSVQLLQKNDTISTSSTFKESVFKDESATYTAPRMHSAVADELA